MPGEQEQRTPSEMEREYSRVTMLLLEVGGVPLDSDEYENGYRACTQQQLTKATETLYSRLRYMPEYVISRYSHQMQLWWLKYQHHSYVRHLKALQRQREEAERQLALSKLSERERQLLGIKQ